MIFISMAQSKTAVIPMLMQWSYCSFALSQWFNKMLLKLSSAKWSFCSDLIVLTHWGWKTHICISKLNINGSDNGLSPGWHQTNIWNNDEILLIWPLGTNFSDMLFKIHIFIFIQENPFENVIWKLAAFCLGLNVLIYDLRPESPPSWSEHRSWFMTFQCHMASQI